MTLEPPLHHEIVAFWRDAGRKRWFDDDPAFDAELRLRFEAAHMAAAAGGYADWDEEAQSALARVLLLDQIPRNLYRGTAHAFATDPLARRVAERAVRRGFDRTVDPALRVFFYLPFEHSEDAADQTWAVLLCEGLGEADANGGYLRYARIHADVIARFGRFPHRNAVLGRQTTEEERAFLDADGFSG